MAIWFVGSAIGGDKESDTTCVPIRVLVNGVGALEGEVVITITTIPALTEISSTPNATVPGTVDVEAARSSHDLVI